MTVRVKNDRMTDDKKKSLVIALVIALVIRLSLLFIYIYIYLMTREERERERTPSRMVIRWTVKTMTTGCTLPKSVVMLSLFLVSETVRKI